MREHRERLDQQQRGSHHQVLARDVEVQRLQHFQVFQVLLRNDAGGDVRGGKLGALDEMQQQVQRTFVDRQAKARRRADFGLLHRLRRLSTHSSTRSMALITGSITMSIESVYNSSNNIKNP